MVSRRPSNRRAKPSKGGARRNTSPAHTRPAASYKDNYKDSRKGNNPIADTTDLLPLTIDRLADDGRGIGYDQGKTIFVDGALAGEQVKTMITKRASKFNEGRVYELLSHSTDRVMPPCPVFSRCGGCNLQHLDAKQQLAFKESSVSSQLQRWAGISPQNQLPAIQVSAYGYRQRVRLAVDYDKTGDLFLGFRESASHRLVNITECAVLEPSLEALLAPLRKWLSAIKAKVVSHMELVCAELVNTVVVRYVRPLDINARQQLATLLPDVDVYFQGGKQAGLDSSSSYKGTIKGVLENASGESQMPRLSYTLQLEKPISLLFHPQDFIQSNLAVNQLMVKQAIELLSPQPHEHIVDLFCGIGNFSLAIAQKAKFVTAIEGVPEMVERARSNAERNHLENLTFLASDLSNPQFRGKIITHNPALKEPLGVDSLLLDPPRSGAKAICEKIDELLPKRIVYVSCNSSTFARDAKILVDKGYTLLTLGVMDMFPQTAHIEIMALFTLTLVNKLSGKSKIVKKVKTGLKLR